MGSAELSAVTLLGWTNPNSILLRGLHHDVFVSNVLDDPAVSSELHVDTLLSMMHIGVPECNILNSLSTD